MASEKDKDGRKRVLPERDISFEPTVLIQGDLESESGIDLLQDTRDAGSGML
jgi:hypothetical protein